MIISVFLTNLEKFEEEGDDGTQEQVGKVFPESRQKVFLESRQKVFPGESHLRRSIYRKKNLRLLTFEEIFGTVNPRGRLGVRSIFKRNLKISSWTHFQKLDLLNSNIFRNWNFLFPFTKKNTILKILNWQNVFLNKD